MKTGWHINSWKWLIPIFILKGLMFSFFAWQLHELEGEKRVGGLFRVYDDTRSYYDPIENLIDGKGYSRFGYAAFNEPEIVPFAGRLPGLLPIYGPLYALFGSTTAKTLMVFIQFVLGCWGVWLLGKIAFFLLKSQLLAKLCMLFYLLYYPLHIYEHAGASESLSIVFFLAAFWLGLHFQENKKTRTLLFSGFFFAWAIFLRPIFGAMLPAFLLTLNFSFNLNFSLTFIRFTLPLILAISCWTLRNAITMKRFIPLEDAWHLSYPHEPEYGAGGMAIRKLIRSWGGDMLYWTEGSMGNMLMNPETTLSIKKDLTKRVYTPDYQADSIELLRTTYLAGEQQKAAEMAGRYLQSYRNHQPLEAWFISRIRMTGKFFFRLIRHDLPFPPKDQLQPYQFLIKGFYILYYYIWAILGLAGGIFILFSKEKQLKKILFFPLAMTFALTCVLGMIEERYLLPLFPFMLIYGLYAVFQWPFMRKIIPLSEKS